MSKDNNFDQLTPEEVSMFCGAQTTLEEIIAAGWTGYASSSGSWWWEHRATHRVFMPHWVRQLEDSARQNGIKSVQQEVCHALGIKGGNCK